MELETMKYAYLKWENLLINCLINWTTSVLLPGELLNMINVPSLALFKGIFKRVFKRKQKEFATLLHYVSLLFNDLDTCLTERKTRINWLIISVIEKITCLF